MSQPSILTLTRSQLREIDRRAIEDYGIPGVVLMENAGRNAAEIIAKLSDEIASPRTQPIAIVCGRGNNGGDGYVIARHLHNMGRAVLLFLAAPMDSLTGDAAMNANIVRRMGLPCHTIDTIEAVERHCDDLHEAFIIVDALLGTGFSGAMRSPFDAIIQAMNAAPRAVRIAIDVPSGLDCDTGAPSPATLRADHTITFVAPKIGFAAPSAAEYVGELHVADIGAPIELIAAVAEER